MSDAIVITGIGTVSNLGMDTETFWENCLKSQSIVDFIPEKWQSYSHYNSGIWSPLSNLNHITEKFNKREVTQRDPVSLLAMEATRQAIDNAGIQTTSCNNKSNQYYLKNIPSDRVGVIIGTGIGGAKTFLENHAHHMLSQYKDHHPSEHEEEFLQCPKRANPFVVSMLMPNSVSASVGIKYSLTGINHTVAQACASGTTAIGTAVNLIKSGKIDYALCGGAEYLYDEYGGIYRGFDVARTLARPKEDISESNRPFDQESTGFLYSQGGATILLIEKATTALERNTGIYAEISGFGESFDAYSMMSIHAEKTHIPDAIRKALNMAKITSGSIDYISTHGTGTKINDTTEAKIITDIYGNNPIVNSTKSLLGHTIGAAGAFEAAVCALSIRDQKVHATRNLKKPISDINFAEKSSPWEINHAISHSFAFGGHNSVLAFKRFQDIGT